MVTSASAFEHLAHHVARLGGVRRLDGAPLQPLEEAELRELDALLAAPLPPAFRWWLATYGHGLGFVEVVVFESGGVPDVLVGDFMTVAEIKGTHRDLDTALVPGRVPFIDDASGNFLVIDASGRVYWHIHDAYTDENSELVAESFEQFVLMLRRAD